MKLKYAKLKDYLTVGKIPIAPNSFDPSVFYSSDSETTPRLLPAIQNQIAKDIEMLCGDQQQRIKKYVLVGDALTPGNEDRTKELKVLIVLNKQLMDIDVEGIISEEILKMIDAMNNQYAIGTLRKIYYVPTVKDINYSEHQAIYDIFTNQWIKLPINLNANNN